MAEILVERHGGWAEIIFNRPDLRNAKLAIRYTASSAGALEWFRPALEVFPQKPFAPVKVA